MLQTLYPHILLLSYISTLPYYVGMLDRKLATRSEPTVGVFLLGYMEPAIHRSIFVAPHSQRIWKLDFGVCSWSIWYQPISGVCFATTVAPPLNFFNPQHETNLGTTRREMSVPNVKCQEAHIHGAYWWQNRWKNSVITGTEWWHQLLWQFAVMGNLIVISHLVIRMSMGY